MTRAESKNGNGADRVNIASSTCSICGFDRLSVLALQSGLGPLDANIENMNRCAGQGRQRDRLAHDGTAAGILRAVDFKHLK
jgi:hypothetical protein